MSSNSGSDIGFCVSKYTTALCFGNSLRSSKLIIFLTISSKSSPVVGSLDHIEEIKKAEQKYLSELNKTIEDTSGKVVESEEIEDA